MCASGIKDKRFYAEIPGKVQGIKSKTHVYFRNKVNNADAD